MAAAVDPSPSAPEDPTFVNPRSRPAPVADPLATAGFVGTLLLLATPMVGGLLAADTNPTKDPMADDLRGDAAARDLPVRLNARVTHLTLTSWSSGSVDR